MDKEVYNFWQTEEPNQGMTARLKPTEEEWYKKSTKLERLSLNLEDTDKTSKSMSGTAIRGFKKEIDQLLGKKKTEARDIYKTLENLKSKIIKLQIRPIDDEHSADDAHKEGKDPIAHLVDDVKEVDELIPNVKREDRSFSAPPADVRAEIQKFKMHLALIRAFLTDLQRFGLKTQTEKAWLEEANEIVSDKETIKTLIKKTRNPQGMSLYLLLTRRAMNELRDEMKRINTGFDEFLERKVRFGFQSIRPFIRRETEPSKSDSGTLQRQASKLKTSDDGFHVESYVNKLKEYELKDSEKKYLTDLYNKFNEVHGKFEIAKSIEGITSSTEERLKQMKKLTEDTEYYLKKYTKNPTDLGGICKLWRNPEKTLRKKLQQIDGALDILAKTTEAYSFEIGEEMRAVGLDDDIQEVVSKLKKSGDDAKHFVCIVGMKGIGKTTLAKNIYDYSDIVDHFPARAWVTLTDQKANDYDDVFKNLAKKVSDSEPNGSQKEENGGGDCEIKNKRYLVVLDNFTAENENVLKALREAFPAGTDGGRILLTTRDRCVAEEVDQSIELHHLRLRTKEESWRLFIQMVDDFGSATNDVKRLAEEIVGRCVGLPLQILQFGYLMSGKDVKDTKLSEWLKRINPPQKPWLDHIQGVGIPDRPDNWKKVFPFFNLFPGDCEIPARRLVALSVAMDDLKQLIDLNLIQAVEINIKGKTKKYRLPSAIREFNFSENKRPENRLADLLDKKSDCFNDIHGNGTLSPTNQQTYKALISYLSFDTREGNIPGEDIGKFLQKGIASGCFQSLEVLDLEHVFRPQLPKTLGKLGHLMYLGLRWTYLEEIPPSIGNLVNLQTLDVKHTYVTTLPKSIWKLQKLERLYLNESHRTKFVSQPRSSSLKDLQILWGLFLDNASDIKNGLNKLNKLKKLGLAFELELSQQHELANWVKGLNSLESLRLRSVDENGDAQDLRLDNLSGLEKLSRLYLFGKLKIPSIKDLFPNTLSDLTLSASGLEDDPMPTLGKLDSLKSLCFYFDSYKGKRMVCQGFSQLQVLKLWYLKELEELKVEKEAMQKLRELEIRSCENLKVYTGFKHLTSLQELKLTKMSSNFTTDIEKRRLEIWYAHPPRITKSTGSPS
ncbi:disease resistance protein RPM1-like [Castanea sativa]|uniref:disease resistance protein RPM1-like n=1 Tax=Castanea sativa TaxID=21020 RepID=UPI003F64E42E